jgi:hypothetical protein
MERSRSSKARGAAPESRHLQLLFSKPSRALLTDLQEAMEAESVSEVARRALIVLETFEPLDIGEAVAADDAPGSGTASERVHLVLPAKSRERLLALRENWQEKGRPCSYAEIIRQALRVTTQLMRNVGRMPAQARSRKNPRLGGYRRQAMECLS